MMRVFNFVSIYKLKHLFHFNCKLVNLYTLKITILSQLTACTPLTTDTHSTDAIIVLFILRLGALYLTDIYGCLLSHEYAELVVWCTTGTPSAFRLMTLSFILQPLHPIS